ncbi:MAG: hypothetical protein EA393_13630 [Bacteroidetes bacterium]|nr:MAG: hypothetical protein EA393_13630 [Bacteroidota bacterium]
MKYIEKFWFVCLLFVLFLLPQNPVAAQSVPDVFNEGTLDEQYQYLHDRTGIYNNFRAIREDMFQRVRRNSLDSLRTAYRAIEAEKQLVLDAKKEKDSIEKVLADVSEERDQAIRDRDSLFLLGIPLSKTFYNALLWSIIGILAVLFVSVLFMFFRSNTITRQKTNDLKELQEEYEDYRKTSRERFEQQSIDHFNELKRLKGI